MIRRFRHRGLRRLFEDDDWRGVNAAHVEKIQRVLGRLASAKGPQHMNLPGWRLHPLKGEYAGYWSVWVNGNWRIIFRMEDGAATDVDLLDYH